jgi:hypothetical protein
VGMAGAPGLLLCRRQRRDRGLREHGGTARARLRHAAHFAAVAEQLNPLIAGQAPQRWLDRLDEDRAELRAAAATAFHGAGEPAADPGMGVRLVAAAFHASLHLRGQRTPSCDGTSAEA